MTTPPKYPIESVDNALRLILELSEQKTIGVSDAGELLGVAPSTAHRLLAMLQYRGFAAQDGDTRSYRAGPALLEVGLRSVRDMDLRQHARPTMERLRDDLDETIHLVVLVGTNVLFLDGAESSRALRVTSRTGMLLPAHCTSAGKALLAELETSELRELYPGQRLGSATSKSIKRRRDLEAELKEVRERGHAINIGESEEGVAAIGAVIRDQRGRVRGALAVAVPASRMQDARAPAMAAALTAACAEIGSRIA